MATDAIHNLITTLTSKDSRTRKRARDQLVEIGQPAVSSLLPLLLENKTYVRWEAAKALSEIGDPGAAPALVNALEDNDSGIRWLAAEGLIRVGQAGLLLLLEALLEHSESSRLREGAGHVLRVLAKNEKLPPQAEPVLQALQGAASDIVTPRAAKVALEMMASEIGE
jgi:HEAT repeat protein